MTLKNNNTFSDFFKQNLWGIVTAFAITAMNYGVVTTKLEQIESRLAQHDEQLSQLANVRTMAFQLDLVQVELKEIKTKIGEYDANIQSFYKVEWVKVERLLERLETEDRVKTKTRNIGLLHGN
jgi:hypothetical protein